MVNFTWFTTFPIFCHQSISFWRNLKNFRFWGGGVHWQIFEFSNFFKSFHINAAENDPQWQILPKKWLRLGQNGHFCTFFYLFPQNEAEIDSEWSISPDSQLFPSFATKASHFWRNLKIFVSGGGGTSANFLSIGKFFEFSNFFKSFHINAAENDPQWQIWPKKWLRLGSKQPFCTFFYLFPQNEADIDSEWSISPDSQLFPSFATKASHFWRNLKNFRSGGGTSANFLSFPTFSYRFTPMLLKMTHNCKFGPKSGLDWVKTAIFAHFSIFSPKMRLRLTRNGQFHLIHNFSHLLPPKHLIFGEISKIFVSKGGTSANFLSFPLFQIISHKCCWKWPTMANLAKKVA